MTGWPFVNTASERRAATLAVIVLVQALCAMFFLGDIIDDVMTADAFFELHSAVELLAAIGLSAGVVFLMFELRGVLNRMDRLDRGVRAARGEMADLIEQMFEQWALTPSERDVALMVVKGYGNEAIAEMRGTAQGTVRAQCTTLYAKAGVEGRAQLLSIFMEELLAQDGST
jgi:DNA-binding CsgD family transcriptional regulator